MRKTVAEALREYILRFPELKDGCLLIDILGNEPVEYTIEPVPCDPVVKKYIDGSCMKQFLFYSPAGNFSARISPSTSATLTSMRISRTG